MSVAVCRPIRLSDTEDSIIILDQTLIPGEEKYIELRTPKDVWDAIHTLALRGAPAIGVGGAFGYYIYARSLLVEDTEDFIRLCQENGRHLDSSRPTAVNLSWAIGRMDKVLLSNRQASVAELKELLRREAISVFDEDREISEKIGEYGFSLMEEFGREIGIMTHCNAGALVSAGIGTALAPIYHALNNGWDPKKIHVYCDETRPLLQGARLSAYEMQKAGVDTYLQCDNMASYTMASGKINMIFVGCDRVAANGDFANKIGTSNVAILAKHYNIPIYCFAPASTIDMQITSGSQIKIEERKGEEVTELWYKSRMAPDGVKVINPSFDVTDHSLVTAFVTDRGIIYPPFDLGFKNANFV